MGAKPFHGVTIPERKKTCMRIGTEYIKKTTDRRNGLRKVLCCMKKKKEKKKTRRELADCSNEDTRDSHKLRMVTGKERFKRATTTYALH